MKGQGAAQASRRGSKLLGRKKTGRGRDEPAEATARPQECVAQTKAPLSGWGNQRGTDKGDPPAWKPPSSDPAWHGAFPTLTLATAPSPLVCPLRLAGSSALSQREHGARVWVCVCMHVCVRARARVYVCVYVCLQQPPAHPLGSALKLRLPDSESQARQSAGHGTTSPLPAPLPGDPDFREAGNSSPLLPQDILLALTPDQA